MLSLYFKDVYINNFECIVGKNERDGNLSKIENVSSDYYNEEKSFELAQIRMEQYVVNKLIKKCNLTEKDINLIVGGDLQNQITGTTYSIVNSGISFLGVYAACSSFIESVIIASDFLKNEKVDNIICLTGSHNLSQERQFRYPVEYGVLRNKNSTFTSTGAISCMLSKKRGTIKVNNATIGSIVDLKINDPNMIGAIMAPSAAEVIMNHLINNKIDINYYDLIITGDLGNVGLNILKDYLYEEFHIKTGNIIDAGSNLYKDISEINDGASGPLVLPLYFFYNILNKKKYKKILLVGTGSLHSSTMVNQNLSIPSIAHAVELEIL